MRLWAAVLTVVAGLLLPRTVSAAEPWWVPVALRGQAVTEVAVTASAIAVSTPGGTLAAAPGSGRFSPDPAAAGILRRGACVRDHPCQARQPHGAFALISSGRVVETGTGAAGRSPDLGAGATLIAAPAALPQTLVAVADDGTVWRRAPDGSWGRSLLLLPRGLTGGVPRVTSITAFDQPLSPAVYLATDGYSVLISNDGGEGWIRAGAELPDRVFAVSADSAGRSVYAGTADGLWVHHVQRLPGPPSYADDLLWWRWLGVVAVALSASAAALALLWRALTGAPPITPSGSGAAPSGGTVAPAARHTRSPDG